MKLFNKVFSGGGKPLIILHGLLGSSSNWLSMGRRLGEIYTAYVLDLRNHGFSPWSDIMDYPSMADDIREFIQNSGFDKASVLGHSMGGKTAMEFALSFPERCEKLIVLDIRPEAYDPVYENIFPALEDIDVSALSSRSEADRILESRIPDKLLRLFLLKNLYRDENGVFHWKVNIRGLSENYDSIWAPVLKKGRTYPGPALFLRGEQSDYLKEEDMDSIRRLFPAAVCKTVSKAGHWLHADNPDELFLYITEFLNNE